MEFRRERGEEGCKFFSAIVPGLQRHQHLHPAAAPRAVRSRARCRAARRHAPCHRSAPVVALALTLAVVVIPAPAAAVVPAAPVILTPTPEVKVTHHMWLTSRVSAGLTSSLSAPETGQSLAAGFVRWGNWVQTRSHSAGQRCRADAWRCGTAEAGPPARRLTTARTCRSRRCRRRARATCRGRGRRSGTPS
jgi:hypothetical protein